GPVAQGGMVVEVVVGDVVDVVEVVGVATSQSGAANESLSKAPMSHRAPAGRTKQRWSDTSHASPPVPTGDGLPASIAGLPGSSGWNGVGPMLTVRTSSIGSTPVTSPGPAAIVQSVVLSTRS